jgi:hypothetical protein
VETKWIKIYDIKDDKDLISQVQKATLETEDYGLVPEIALYGSQEWWDAINKGDIPRQEIIGTISRVYMTGHNDWPEFEVDSGEEKTSWTRKGNDEFYETGRPVKLEYVVQKAKKSWTGSPYQNEVLTISVGQ